MLLEIRHITEYRYDEPVRESVMELWMQPQRSLTQRLINFELELDPPAKLFSYPDAFGNAVYHFDVPQPHTKLTITARSGVETEAPEPLPETLDRLEWDRLKAEAMRGDKFDFLQPHGFARETRALRQFERANGIDALRKEDPLTAVRGLARVIHDAFDYEAGVTRADSPIDDVLKHGKGVCQDFAHLMIATCRSWGIPARYVSGYLFTDRDSGDRSDPDASHAWVEVFLPSLRWVGFDPTNNILAGERHVVCAIGRDYSDVPPSRGVYKGEADHQLAVGVSVRKARAAISEPEFLKVSRPTARGGAPGRRGQPGSAAYEQQQRLHQMQQQQQ
jgi:transglutaminase-like putative cysteine protease